MYRFGIRAAYHRLGTGLVRVFMDFVMEAIPALQTKEKVSRGNTMLMYEHNDTRVPISDHLPPLHLQVPKKTKANTANGNYEMAMY